eukprot:scaffold79322_cov21-Tisochrysis_lutea.AAC.1
MDFRKGAVCHSVPAATFCSQARMLSVQKQRMRKESNVAFCDRGNFLLKGQNGECAETKDERRKQRHTLWPLSPQVGQLAHTD